MIQFDLGFEGTIGFRSKVGENEDSLDWLEQAGAREESMTTLPNAQRL